MLEAAILLSGLWPMEESDNLKDECVWVALEVVSQVARANLHTMRDNAHFSNRVIQCGLVGLICAKDCYLMYKCFSQALLVENETRESEETGAGEDFSWL